jgi:hypothetical protein
MKYPIFVLKPLNEDRVNAKDYFSPTVSIKTKENSYIFVTQYGGRVIALMVV